MCVDQGSTIQFGSGNWMSFMDPLLFPGWLFWRMESMNVAGTLQEAGDADSRDHTRSQVKWDVSSFFIFIHLLDYLFCIRNAMSFALLLQIMEGWWGDRWGSLVYIRGIWVGDTRWVPSYSFCSFVGGFVFCSLMSLSPLFKWLEHDGCCACFFVFSLLSLSLGWFF